MPTVFTEFSLHQKRMYLASGSAQGVVDKDTVLSFSEVDGIVTGVYSGGRIKAGVLAGTRAGSSLEFRYAQVDEDGHVDGGRSTCRLEVLADGRLRLVENFTWESRIGSGCNLFEEVFADHSA